MIIEKKLLKDLNPAPYNPRKSTEKQEKQLKRSLEKFGVVEPIIWNKQTGYIVGGHFRVRELKKLGYKEVDCVIVDLNEEDEKELNIRLNANTGEWNWEELQSDWDVEQLEDWGLDVPKNKELNEEDLFDIDLPFYTPSEIEPNINELADLNKTKELFEKINKLDVSEDLKEVLRARASFFTDFNFQKIADFYVKQNREVQELFKDLGMIILAPKEALEKGFVELSNYLIEE